MSLACLPFFEEEEKGQGRRRKCMKKVEDDRSAERSKHRCSKCANILNAVAVCIDMGDLILPKSKCATHYKHTQKREGGHPLRDCRDPLLSPPNPVTLKTATTRTSNAWRRFPSSADPSWRRSCGSNQNLKGIEGGPGGSRLDS